MAKSFAQKIFTRWLAINGHRFRHPPHLIFDHKEYFILRFTGITSKIQCLIRAQGTVEVIVTHPRTDGWEILMDFDVCEHSNPSGQYYCSECSPTEFFPSREALWETHCFETLLAWTNTYFDESRWLCLFSVGCGSTYAKLIKIEDVHAQTMKESCVYKCPVVNKQF